MKNTQHTPGPWRIAGASSAPYLNIENKDGWDVCAIDDCHQQAANALLIASAPELLEEARLSITYLELSLKAHDYLTTLEHERLVRLRELVAKAGGNA
jgi:hypothetical protein